MSDSKTHKAGGPTWRSLEERVNEQLKPLSVNGTLHDRIKQFLRGTVPREPPSKLEELNSTYAEVSKAGLFAATNLCATLVVFAVQYAHIHNKNANILSTADALRTKWFRCADANKNTLYWNLALRERSVEDVREMLASALADLETYTEVLSAEQSMKTPRIKPDVGQPEPGKHWY